MSAKVPDRKTAIDEKARAMSTAKALAAQDDKAEAVVLSTGYRARIVPIGASIIEEMVAIVQNPEVPVVMNEDKGREEPNPLDPGYIRAMREATAKRGLFAMDAMIMFGLELLDPLPEDGMWIKKLRFLEKRGGLDLSGYDLDDELEREFVFKRYIATGTADLIRIGRKAGLSPEAVAEAAKSFPNN